MILLYFVDTAQAVNVKFCMKIKTDFTDAAPDISVYDDYLHDNDTERPLAGVYIEANDNGVGSDFGGYADDSGSDRGCRTFPLVTGHSYTIRILSQSIVANHSVLSYQANGTLAVVAQPIPYTAPALPATETYVKNGGRVWSNLALASWALFHRDAGIYGGTWTLYDDDCPNEPTGTLCIDCDLNQNLAKSDECGGTDTFESAVLHVGSSSRTMVAHELGHLLAVKAGGALGNNDTSADTEDCHKIGMLGENYNTSHSFQTKEYYSEALWEGFASFYAAVVFNDSSGGDCYVHYYKASNFDNDLDNDPIVNNSAAVNCDGVPDILPGGGHSEPGDNVLNCVTASGYLSDSNVGCACGTASLYNRGTEYDMVRFGWDLYADPDFTFTDIVGVLSNVWATGFDGSNDNVNNHQPAEVVYDEAYNYFTQGLADQWYGYMIDNDFDEGL